MHLSREQKRQVNRQQLCSVLHEGKGRPGHLFNFALTVLIIISVAIIPLEFLPEYPRYRALIFTIEAIIVALFTLEYGLRIYAAPNRLRYIFSFFGIVDLLSILPFYAGLFGTEYIRMVRLIRFFKLAEIDAAAQNDEELAMQRGIGLVDGEKVEYVATKSPVVLLVGVIPSIVAVMFGIGILLTFDGYIALSVCITLILFSLLLLWKAWLDFSYDVIYITNYRLIFQNQHILGRSINQVNYPSITNVKPHSPDPLSYLLRYGSLVIDTAAEGHGQIGLHMVRKHEQAAHAIMQRCFVPPADVSTPEGT